MSQNQNQNESTCPDLPARQLLTGQAAIVTGANSGIGKAVAIALGASGAKVCVNYYAGDDAAQEVVDEIESKGGEGFIHKTDVSKEDEVIADV